MPAHSPVISPIMSTNENRTPGTTTKDSCTLKFSCPEVTSTSSSRELSNLSQDSQGKKDDDEAVLEENQNEEGKEKDKAVNITGNHSNGNGRGGRTRHPRTESGSSALSIDSSSESAVFVPPDGGWGWVVVFAAFLVNMIADGVTFSFGVLYVDFLLYFKESKSKTAWIGSLFMGVPLLAGPIASSLTDRYGCRQVTICGALLASLGFLIGSFCNSLEALFFVFTVSGFGLALCYVAAIVIVAYYFEKRRALATGLSVCGSGIGTCLFAPLTQHLVDQYTWRGALLILSGLFLNIIVCGALMRNLEWTPRKKSVRMSAESISQKSQITPEEARKLLLSGGGINFKDYPYYMNGNAIPEDLQDCDRLCNSLLNLPTFVKQGESFPKELVERLGRQPVNFEYFLKHYPHLVVSHSNHNCLAFTEIPNGSATNNNAVLSPTNDTQQLGNNHTSEHHLSNTNIIATGDMDDSGFRYRGPQSANRRLSAAYFQNLRLHRKSMTHRNAMLNTHRYHIRASSCPDIYRNSMITIAQEEENEVCSCMDDLKGIFKDMLDFSYFKNLKFLIFCISNLLLYIWYDVPYVYIPDNAQINGIDEDSASYLVSLIGILNTLGEIVFGFVGDIPCLSGLVLYSVSMAICGIVIGLVPLLKSFSGIALCSSLFGLTISANYALTSIIIVDLITLENFTNAYGLLLLIQGIANLIGPPLAGWLYDVTGNYDLSFYMSGVWIFISGAIITILPLWRRYLRRSKSKPANLCNISNERKQIRNNNKDTSTTATATATTPLKDMPVTERKTRVRLADSGTSISIEDRNSNNNKKIGNETPV